MRPASFRHTITLATPDNMINGGYAFEAPNPPSWRRCSIAAAHVPSTVRRRGIAPLHAPAAHERTREFEPVGRRVITLGLIDGPPRRRRQTGSPGRHRRPLLTH